jgi:hypothetical protein
MELNLHRAIDRLLSPGKPDREPRANQIYNVAQRINKIMNISPQSGNSLLGTCNVCGKPVHELVAGVPSLPGGSKFACSQCGKEVCAGCYSQSRKQCVRCTTNRDSWCKTPKVL